jgi:hypothetical protein
MSPVRRGAEVWMPKECSLRSAGCLYGPPHDHNLAKRQIEPIVVTRTQIVSCARLTKDSYEFVNGCTSMHCTESHSHAAANCACGCMQLLLPPKDVKLSRFKRIRLMFVCESASVEVMHAVLESPGAYTVTQTHGRLSMLSNCVQSSFHCIDDPGMQCVDWNVHTQARKTCDQ